MYKEFLKEKISFLKLWLTLLIAIDAGSTAWLFNNYEKIKFYKVCSVIFVLILVTMAIIVISKKTYKLIKQIKSSGENNVY